VRSEEGWIVDDHLAAGVIWSGSEPSFEDVQADAARMERLKTLEDDIRAG
jgi:hypothetical protein